MSEQANNAVSAAVRRVCCDTRSRRAADAYEFRPGATVRSLRPVRNDGVYPHKDIGEVLVRQGDTGVVRERWSFLGEVYYTVEFGDRAAVVIMRGREMVS